MHGAAAPLVAAVVLFAYYTTWVFALPFIDEDRAFHDFIPPREYAFALPAVGLSLTIIGAFAVYLFPAKFDAVHDADREVL